MLSLRTHTLQADAARPDRMLEGGDFIGDFRLFLGTSRSRKTATCLSFCELISVDVQRFRSLMADQLPELFDTLVIYTSIDNYCPKLLVHCLEEQGLSAEVPLLFGEGVLHHCAKVNAVGCAERLIEEIGADVTVLDEDEKLPAQVAAELKHKEVFWTIIKHGSVVMDSDVLTRDEHAVRGKRGRRSVRMTAVKSIASDEHSEPHTPQDIREMMVNSGLDLSLYDEGVHKSLDDLVSETQTKSELAGFASSTDKHRC